MMELPKIELPKLELPKIELPKIELPKLEFPKLEMPKLEMPKFELPRIIQGGMGVGVSNWRLAQAVSKIGQLGVVSGTALDSLMVRRLADGDMGGHMRRAFDNFPFPDMAKRIWNEYFVPGGKAPEAQYPLIAMHQKREPSKLLELCVISNFAEVFLAKEGHKNPVGINFLEKVQMPHLASIYGAMLAGVGYVLMGAGIPMHIPGILDAFAANQAAEYRLAVAGAKPDLDVTMHFNPAELIGVELPQLERPKFLAIVSSNTLAQSLLKRANGRVDGFIIEGATAGGHNAPPRGKMQLNDRGEPIYGDRDRPDLAGFRQMGVPFWLAGGFGTPEKVQEAVDEGATGVQVGTAFALTEESGLREDLKATLIEQARAGTAEVFTDPLASPTGFPFKVARIEGSYSEANVAEARERICDLGYLREAYATPNGGIGYRCAAEPEDKFVAKGGDVSECAGRKCLCNALMANIGHAQPRRDGSIEPALVTMGDDIDSVARMLADGRSSYTAAEAVEQMLGARVEALAKAV